MNTAEWAERALAEAAVGQEPLSREEQVLERIERARRRKPKVTEERVTMAHGAGGKASRTLIQAVFVDAFANPALQRLDDGATLDLGTGRLVFTTDAYVVSPLFFPGGDIGDLAVNGTVNDLAVCGARPMYLSAGFVLEEGFPVADLRRITASMAAAAERAGVRVVTGDTKVVQRGKADGCYVTTSGIGALERPVTLGESRVRPGDAVIVSGPVGEHGVTVMIARGELDIEADLTSDTAPVHEAVAALLDAVPVRMMRDATRGGVATILNEIAVGAGLAVTAGERAIPVRPVVSGACELLGLDPLYVACEGRFVAVVDGDHAAAAVRALRRHPVSEGAAVVGTVEAGPPGMVLLKTASGGTRIVDLLVGDPLPRIC
ncbi:hydrogenase expression/formation protein HypE [Nonomuraea ferruginea]|uniref:Hydrogenase expression/formation protein HypE n=1 Tax=Nonomuraea ferruginea TaxID=46174 RepID=A0ABT4T6T4_9ACTN|nr:hydrogenase expression/formation protein HypE [Nonomuraea ferruginea]MDA0645134.1 hydrogenase expression/formation protein HypE [Nonomuraea ferruginea]